MTSGIADLTQGRAAVNSSYLTGVPWWKLATYWDGAESSDELRLVGMLQRMPQGDVLVRLRPLLPQVDECSSVSPKLIPNWDGILTPY